MTDKELTHTVRCSLVVLLDDFDTVRVEVEQGIVYLEGIVGDAAQKRAIQQMILHLPAVRRVINCLALEHLAVLHPPYVAPSVQLFLS